MSRALVLILVLILTILAGGAQAQGLYDVAGVAANDALNVRAEPLNAGRVVGTLPYDATNIRVTRISPNGLWGHVTYDGASGWVYLDYLRAKGGFPDTLDCTGTEPFWSLSVRPDSTVLDEMSGPGFDGSVGDRVTAEVRTDHWSLRVFEDGQSLTAVIGARQCSDGMSDRDYPYGVDVILSTEDAHRHLSGCCVRP